MVRLTRRGVPPLVAVLLLVLSGCTGGGPAALSSATTVPAGPVGPSATPTGTPASSAAVPARPDHVVVVIFENKAYGQIAGNAQAPYLNSLIAESAVFPDARAVAHPSQPNYLALFSGSTQGVPDDRCPLALGNRPNLARQLLDAGLSFTGYSEDLPRAGYTGCGHAGYAAKHAPWVHFDNVPAATGQPLSAFPTDFTQLPTVSFVVPNLCNDMHDCAVGTGDRWASTHIDAYARWALTHHSLLVVTFDENDNSSGNQILTMIVGGMVRGGKYAEPVNHYRILATLERLYGLPALGNAAQTTPITDVWV